ncbi:MAG: bifunctional diaminohydroxyphosphoribosylaminopyrimidine deaminase/5-amino-6-(5-phosphoribosylamino)uracil reductase RibD [Pirellulaceae bacterium]
MSDDSQFMRRALELASRGRGYVEPNPMVGCVIVAGEGSTAGDVVGEGWHRQFGGPHAEIEALRIAGSRARGATMYVTLEPCSHHGKTPPCCEAVVSAGVARVVVAQEDPFPEVAGRGIRTLREAGLHVEVGVAEVEATTLNAPYLKLLSTRRPWVIAKWAMTLDGKIATSAGDSRWISGGASRAVVHELRGRVDAILVGSGTAHTDDPLLTARPPGARTALRIVVDSRASLASTSRLAATAREIPLLAAVGREAPEKERLRLQELGCEVLSCDGATHADRLAQLLDELGRRRMTNVLVEGGARLLGTCFDMRAVDEAHVFVAAKVFGGQSAPTAVGGEGVPRVADALWMDAPAITELDGDVYLHGRLSRNQRDAATRRT